MKTALLLVALMLVPLLPFAQAAGPEPRSWGTYNAGVDVAGLAMAAEGTTIVAALRNPPAQPPTTVPGLPESPTTRNDIAVLDYQYGFARNFTVNVASNDGRTMLAVSRDGSTIADLRRDVILIPAASPDASAQHIFFHYAHIVPGGNWSAGPNYERAIDLGQLNAVTVVAIALSDDGHRVALLTGEGSNYVLRGYSLGATSLDNAFEIRAPGTPRALAASGDMSRLVVAGQFPQGNFTYGGAFVLPFAQGEPVASTFDTSANNTDTRSVVLSRDGNTLALGGGDGKLRLFHDSYHGLPSQTSLTLGSAAIVNLTMSEDGTRAASAIGTAVTAIDTQSPTPVVLWNTTVGGTNVTGLAMNRTGAILVVGTSGTGGGVQAYTDVDSTLLWSIPGDTRGVAIDSAGTRIAYAQRTTIAAARIPRALTMDLTIGGKVAPTATVTVPGTTTLSVNLRNDGAALERVVIEESSPDVTVEAAQGVISVRPGAIVRVNLTVNVSASLLGPRVFNVTARSLTSGALDNVTMSVAPKPTLDVKLLVAQTDVLAEAGKPSDMLVTIVNNGTSDAPVILRATQTVSSGALWNLSLSETQLTALRGTRTSVKVTITPPTATPNGTGATVTYTLEGQDIFDVARVSLRINPELKVEVNATGVTKLIEPGKKAFYNVTVTNIGSLPRTFDVFQTITSSDNRNWGVDMAAEKVRLEPLAKRTFAVSIVAPADALPQEKVSVVVTARSIPELPNETYVQDNVTLYGIAVAPKITTTTTPNNGIPFLAPLAAVATLFAIAGLRRRRAP